LPCNAYPLGQVFPQASDPEIQNGITAAQGLNLQQWWNDRYENYDFENEDDEFADWEDLGGDASASQDLPEESSNLREALPESPDFAITRDILSLRHRPVWLTLFPQIPAWQIPLYLQYGSWNDCPFPEEHAAVLAYWQQYYGAELFGLDEATLELWVAEPPTTEAATLRLAKEHFAYCEDIVSQGTMTVARLTQILRGSDHWYFWWD